MLPPEPERGCRGRAEGDEPGEDAVDDCGETELGDVCCGQLPRGAGIELSGGLTRGKLDLRVAGYNDAGSGENCTIDSGAGAGLEGSYEGSGLGARSLAVNLGGGARVACLAV